MDKQAFKQRMQNLKSYRENNPGKGYIQFMEELAKAKSKEWKEDEDMTLLQMLNDNTYNYKQMYEDNPDYNIQEGHFKDTYKTVYHPTFSNESMYSGQKSQYNPEGIIGGWWDYDNKIFHANPKQDLNYTQWYLDREDPGWKVQAYTWHEGVGHMVGDNTPAILNAAPNVRISNPDSSYEDYVNQANEKHAQTWDFRGNNSNLKDDQGNYYIDPNRQLTPEDISNMRSKGAKIPEQWESLKDADISELTNTFAYNLSQDPIYYMASGGEVGDPDDKFAKAVNTKLGRTPDGRPLQQGLKPVFDLEDAANLTPVGDVITTKDIYNSVKESDWSNAGLAALTLLPFVPSGIRNIKAATRYVPSVNKGLDQRMLDNAFNSIKEKREYLSDVANERNRVLESVNGYAHRVRAQKADQMFGTNYNETYDLLSDLYEHHFFDLPEVQAKDMPQIGKMEAKASAKTRYNDTGVGAGPNDFDFLVNVDRPIDAKEIARHEMNHYTDYLISRNPNTTTNNNMLKQLESSLKNTDEKEYFRRGTEQKAHMNQLRARMYEDGAISSLDELVTPSMIKSYIDKLGDKDSIKRAYKQHKSLSSYTKWFNSIPLLGVGAIGVNKYFNNGTEQEK